MKKGPVTRRTTLRIPPELHKRLRLHAARTDSTVTRLLLDGARLLLAQQKKRSKP